MLGKPRRKVSKEFVLAIVSVGVGLLVLTAPGRLYADGSSWVAGDFPVLSVTSTTTTAPKVLPACTPADYVYFTYGTNPRSEGQNVSATGCETGNSAGTFINSNPNNTGDNYDFIKPRTSLAFRVLRPGGRQSTVTPVPNQTGFLWKEPSSHWGNPVALHFYTSFSAAGDFSQYSYGSNVVPWDLAYELNTNGTVLKDRAGNVLYMHAYAFSQNGQWMVAEAEGLGLVRIDTTTLAMQLFDTTHLAYNLGFSPQMSLAVSDDGNAVIRSGSNAGDTMVYDLSGCQQQPFTVGASNVSAIAGCQSRDVQQNIRSQLSTYQYMRGMRFSPDDQSVTAVAISTGLNGIWLYNNASYSVAGYTAPHVSYLALGDSFSSGEGEFNYVAGTDNDNPKNKCHLSTLSYPYLTAAALGISDFHSVACSGALYDPHYKTSPEFKGSVTQSALGIWLPGIKVQQDYISVSMPNVVTISMIGNDIGFGDKLATCLLGVDDCYHFKQDREMIANEIYSKFDDLVNLYDDIKTRANNDNVQVYVLGYPQIMGSYDCQVNVPFSPEERQMAQELTSYLDAVIKAATRRAGVQYIDTEHAFDGHRLCDQGDAEKAVNGLTAGNDRWPVSNGSFHPNVLGHQLMSDALLAQSQNFTAQMPAPDSSAHAPYIGSDVYNNFVVNAPSANFLGVVDYTSPTTTVVRSTMTVLDYVKQNSVVTLNEETLPLPPNTAYAVTLRSDPVSLGTLTTDALGNLGGDVTIPVGIAPGYHTIHITGKDIGGQDIDMYQVVYVAASADDLNGDGVPNDQDPCVIVPASGIDQDKDGIDDACDADIEPAPADTVPPQVTGIPDREPDHNGWYSQDVTVHWTANDPDPSSGSPSQPDDTVANLEGDHTYTSAQSCDPAGNCAAGNIAIKLDKTAPSITYTAVPQQDSSGWNNSDVTVTFNCSDATSGIADCPDPVTVTESGSHSIVGAAVDNAGNAASVTAAVNIDKNMPAIGSLQWTNNPKPTAGTATLSVQADDDLSGIARVEYFIGDDPGNGNGIEIPADAGGYTAAFGADIAPGAYTVTVRAEDTAGNWSVSASDYLVVQSPYGVLTAGAGWFTLSAHDVVPVGFSGDGLSTFQFALATRPGDQRVRGEVQFVYTTGVFCPLPRLASGCHTLVLRSTDIAWLTTQGMLSPTGMSEGAATLDVDGVSQRVLFTLAVSPGNMAYPGNFTLRVYQLGDNPSSAAPLYQFDDAAHGIIRVRS